MRSAHRINMVNILASNFKILQGIQNCLNWIKNILMNIEP